jgi:hypothetical protein
LSLQVWLCGSIRSFVLRVVLCGEACRHASPHNTMYMVASFVWKMNFTVCFLSRRISFTIQVLSYHFLWLVTVTNVPVGMFITRNACYSVSATELRLDPILKDMLHIWKWLSPALFWMCFFSVLQVQIFSHNFNIFTSQELVKWRLKWRRPEKLCTLCRPICCYSSDSDWLQIH